MQTYAFALTARGLALMGPRADSPPILHELAPGVIGPAEPDDPTHFELLDPRAFEQALSNCLQRLGRSVKRAHLAIDGGLLRHLNLPLSYVPERQELKTVVLTELERYALFSGTEIAFDVTVLRQQSDALTVLMAAFRLDRLKPILEAFAAQGVTITSVEPAIMALLRSWGGPKPEAPCGMIAVGTHHLDVASWADGRPTSWRRIYLDANQLEDPGQTSETVVELQRSMIDVAVNTWQVINLPDAIVTSLAQRPGTEFIREYPDELVEMAEGALQFGPEAMPTAFDVLPEAAVPQRALNNKQWALLGVMAGILTLSLLASIFLDSRIRGLRASLDRIQSQTLELETTLQSNAGAGSQREAAEAFLKGTTLGASLLDQLQGVTPSDAWMTEASLELGKKLTLSGYALSRTSPLAFARSLEGMSPLSEIAIPILEQSETDGSKAYRFVIEASLADSKERP